MDHLNMSPKTRSRTLLKAGSGCAFAALLFCTLHPAISAENSVVIPAPSVDEPASARQETAVFAGGCFWGVQGVFQHVRGVTSAVSGYAGGNAASATYGNVSDGTTGHAEAVQVTFDPSQVSYGKLLQIFFSVVHNPTELDRQGPDHGKQYRSAIFPASTTQKQIAAAYIAQLGAAHVFNAPIVTTIEDGKHFYPAESYHQNFLATHPDSSYIVVNDLPKIDQLKKIMPAQYRANPVLVKEDAV